MSGVSMLFGSSREFVGVGLLLLQGGIRGNLAVGLTNDGAVPLRVLSLQYSLRRLYPSLVAASRALNTPLLRSERIHPGSLPNFAETDDSNRGYSVFDL